MERKATHLFGLLFFVLADNELAAMKLLLQFLRLLYCGHVHMM